jgi:hypothetical protein
MLQSSEPDQINMEFVYIDQLVPKNHLLRIPRKYINFSFIADKVRGLYCPENGRSIYISITVSQIA